MIRKPADLTLCQQVLWTDAERAFLPRQPDVFERWVGDFMFARGERWPAEMAQVPRSPLIVNRIGP